MAATLWFYVRDDKRQGPVDFEHLVTLLLAGQVPHNALVWHQGLREWSPADTIAEIAEQLPPPLPEPPKIPAPPAMIPAPAAPPPAPQAPAPQAPAPAAPAPVVAAPAPIPAAAGSPRVEELRKRMEKDPGSRLFAQLAEELRKEGQLEEAILLCRAGLVRHPSYPSARITLARALLDSGDTAAARTELVTVVQAAPDNIMARKLLDECEGATPAAPGEAASSSAPGKWWRSLLGGPGGTASPAAAAPRATPEPAVAAAGPASAAPPVVSPPVTAAGAAPPAIDAGVDEEPELPTRPPDEDLPPIPVVPADDEPFELVAPYEGPVPRRAPPASGDTGPISVLPAALAAAAAAAAATSAVPPAPPAPSAPPPPTVAPPLVATPPAVVVPAVAAPLAVVVPDAPPAAAPVPAGPPPVPSSTRPPARKSSSPRGGRVEEDITSSAPRIFVPALMPPTGSLADTDFPDLIHGLNDRRWTGTIELNRGRIDSAVTVQGGRLTFATSTNRDDRLGELLLRKEQITLRQYYEAGKSIRKGKRLGAVLVEQGALNAKDLVKAVVDHTQEVIYSVFQWTEGFYRLREGLEGDGETITLKLSTANIILEGIHRITAWSRVERGVGGPDARYVRAPDYQEKLPEMTLPPDKLRLLTGHEGERDVDTMCRESTLSDYEVCRSIWAFRVIGVLKQVPLAGPRPS